MSPRSSSDAATSAEPPSPMLSVALPLRCQPIDGESFASLAMRLAKANGLYRTEQLFEAASLPSVSLRSPDPAASLVLAILSGQEPTRILEMSPSCRPRSGNFAPGDLRRTFLELIGQELEWEDLAADRRACPACVAESPHEPLLWHVDALAGCLKHDVLFVDSCTCGRKLDWSGWVDTCPKCFAPVSRLAARPMPPNDRAVTAYVEGRLRKTPAASVPRLDALRFAAALKLVRWVGAVTWEPGRERGSRAFYAAGYAAILGPREELLAKVRAGAGHVNHVGAKAELASAKVGRGRLQPAFPGLVPDEVEPIAALVREAASV